ncbi:MAG: HAMP domain-containing histidine kinase, partial [Acidobacteria bacterium]|nr:HAMP domain-containing histidine kinase [Acidobacteriota bacterium]
MSEELSHRDSFRLAEVLATPELARRPSRPPDLSAENRAMHAIARHFADPPEATLRQLVDLAMDLCSAGSAGISLPESAPSGDVFRWVVMAGVRAPQQGGSSPRHFSPCAVCMERGGPQLFQYPDRYFTYLRGLSPRAVEVLVVPLGEGDRVLGTIWVVSHDETRRFDREDVRVMSSLASFAAAAVRSASLHVEARAASAAKDQFLATVSHELRAPLNAILGWAEMARLGMIEGDEVRRALDVIRLSATHQARLVDELLDVSRSAAGTLRLARGPVHVADALRAAMDAALPAAVHKGVTIRARIEADDDLVLGDRFRLQQVAANLLLNAVKFTPAGGVITVGLARAEDDVQLTVSDTGVGIDAAFLPNVFERFRQSDSSTTRRHEGLGLGLWIVRELVELHGGTITARSDGEGRGATFVVALPRHEQAAPAWPERGGRDRAAELEPP